MWQPDLSQTLWRGFVVYLSAVLAVATAAGATFAFGPALTHTPTLFFCAVVFSSWIGGVWPGILASVLSALALDYCFIAPIFALGIRLEEAPDMIVFVLSALFISGLSGAQQRAEAFLRQARNELETKVAQRTTELVRTNGQLWTEIAERKRAEESLIRAQAEIARVMRVMAMGELAASIAHELNQPLAGVVLNANVALRWLAVQPPNLAEAREALECAIQDGTRASEVLQRVRGFLTKGERVKECVNLHELLREIIALTQGELSRNKVMLRTEFTDDLPEVVADRIQLQQIMLNLVMNAIEAMSTVPPGCRLLCIRTAQPGPGTVQVIVRDSGVGLTPEQQARIFDSFYTTKSSGIGMGLRISCLIANAHGGELSATANKGCGATFQLTLPNKHGQRM